MSAESKREAAPDDVERAIRETVQAHDASVAEWIKGWKAKIGANRPAAATGKNGAGAQKSMGQEGSQSEVE